MCLRTGRGGEDVGISNRRGTRCMSALARTRGVGEVSLTCDSDSVAEADGSLMFPEVLRLPGSSSPMLAKYFWVRRWARM